LKFKRLSILISILTLIVSLVSILKIYSLDVLYLEGVLVILGLLIMGRSLDKRPNKISIVSFFVGVFVVVIGILPLLIKYQLLRFIPFSLGLSVNLLFLEVMIIVSSVYLIVDSL